MNISEEIIQKVKDQNDIVDVISETVKLKRAGKYYSGLCPFHHEKSPSFTVTPEKQIYKCFGCGEAGNVITFIMKNKNLSFLDAVKFLAERANIPIIYTNGKDGNVVDPREKMYKINVEAARYFFGNLRKSSKAISYFQGRGISDSTVKRFGLGFSLDNWNGLLNYLKTKGFTELDMLSAGLIIKSEKGNYYDRFRNRAMFPVFDYMGKVIGFGGRVLDDSKPKYLNSPETQLFKKGTNLYGLNFAIKNDIGRTIIIVEGYMDCISLHQYGITNAVASLGTALTENQAKLLKRYAEKIIISYDADVAGQNATVRGMEILRNQGFDVRILTVPQGKDPDEYIRSNGREAFVKLMNDAMPLIDYRLKKAKEGIDFNNPEAVASYAKRAALVVKDLNPVEKDIYIKRVSEETRIKEQSIYDLLNNEMQKNVNNSSEMNNVNNFGQKLFLEPAYMKAERNILKFMLNDEESMSNVTKIINKDELVLEGHKKIFQLIIDSTDKSNESRIKHIEANCDDIDSSSEWVKICELDLIYEKSEGQKLIEDYVKEIKKFKLEESKKQIMDKIKHYEAIGNFKESVELAQQLVKIRQEANRL